MGAKKDNIVDANAVVDALMSDPSRERHHFIDRVDMDRLVAAILRLTMEVSVLRDRLATHESLAAQYGGYSQDEVEAYNPTAEENQRRAQSRQNLVARIVRDLT